MRGEAKHRSRANRAPASSRRRALASPRLCGEHLEGRAVLASVPFGATPSDTAEIFVGKVLVNVVAMESNGTLDPSTENWTPATLQAAKDKVEQGMQWWVDTLAALNTQHSLEFVYDYTYADNPVGTRYEPITQSSGTFAFWVQEFLQYTSYARTGDFQQDLRTFNHDQRVAHEANWSFTLFLVNSTNDTDDAFGPAPSTSRAFAYPGGICIVVPSDRPVYSYAHEVAHEFWGFDEYSGSDPYTDTRGYYNTQNFNGLTGHSGFTQQASIMAAGTSLQQSFSSHILPQSTREVLGWKDSDADGIFDAFDVPHTLTGTGWLDTASGNYRFQGESRVQTLANQNTEGNQSDITLNKISRAEYRIDGGAWTTAATYNTYSANLNLSIPLSSGSHTVEIRTIDAATGVTSPIFSSSVTRSISIAPPGINGFVWNDTDANGLWDEGETPLSGWTVQLQNSTGQAVANSGTIEPDSYAEGTILNSVQSGVTITSQGSGVVPPNVSARAGGPTSTGTKTFHYLYNNGTTNEWSNSWSETRQLKVSFTTAVSRVSIDAIANSAGDYARIEAFDLQGNLLARSTSGALADGMKETLSIGRNTPDIKYVVISGHAGTSVSLDNLKYGAPVAAVTNAQGAYSFPYLVSGSYRIVISPPSGWQATTDTIQNITFSAGSQQSNRDFGVQGTGGIPYRNSVDPYDVDANGTVDRGDLALLSHWIRHVGYGPLAAPTNLVTAFVDLNGDNALSVDDLDLLTNQLQVGNQQGEGGGGGGGGPQGEFAADPIVIPPATSEVSDPIAPLPSTSPLPASRIVPPSSGMTPELLRQLDRELDGHELKKVDEIFAKLAKKMAKTASEVKGVVAVKVAGSTVPKKTETAKKGSEVKSPLLSVKPASKLALAVKAASRIRSK